MTGYRWYDKVALAILAVCGIAAVAVAVGMTVLLVRLW
jgi:hypothetical protein